MIHDQVKRDIFRGAEYTALSRECKADRIWAKVTESTRSAAWQEPAAFFSQGQDEVFDTEGDELAPGRTKAIHTVGTVAKVQWVSTDDHPYTGIFRGSDTGFARFSVGSPVQNDPLPVVPSLAVKMMRDGVDSANIFGMHGFEGASGMNFFKHCWSNNVPTFTSPALAPVFAKFGEATTSYGTANGLSNMARYTQDGQEEQQIVFPFEIRFEPTAEAQVSADEATSYLDHVAMIPSGATLFKVYALDAPRELGGSEHLIGNIVMRSSGTRSTWGDKKMFFRHQRKEDDFAFRPEWEPYFFNTKAGHEAEAEEAQPAAQAAQARCPVTQSAAPASSGCPFAGIRNFFK